MFNVFFSIMNMLINNMTKEQIFLEICGLAKNLSERDIDKIVEYFFGESLNMKRTLSRENMISKGISEEHVDYVIKEIEVFHDEFEMTDEMRSQCGYENMELADFLWREYCSRNNREEFAECADDLRNGFFVLAKAWNKPQGEEPIIEFIKRIDSKGSRILLCVEEVKNDTKEIKADTIGLKTDLKSISCNINNGFEKMSSEFAKMSGNIAEAGGGIVDVKQDTGEIIRILTEDLRLSPAKNREVKQAADNRKEQNSGIAVDEPGTPLSEKPSEQKESGAEEQTPDEIKLYLAASPDEFQDEIDSLKEFIEEQNHCQEAVRLRLQCHNDEVGRNIQECKYCYILIGNNAEKWAQEIYEQTYGINLDASSAAECIQLRLAFRNLSGEDVNRVDHSRTKLEERYRKDFKQAPIRFSDIDRIKLDILQNLKDDAPDVKFSVKSILQFRNNTDFEEACRKQDSLQKQYRDAGEVLSIDKSPDEKENMELLEEELKAQNDIVEKMEKEIWNNLNLLMDKQQNAGAMDAREAEAIESVVEHGNYNKADVLLCSKEWNREIVDLEQSMKDQKEILRQFISAQRTLISNLKMKGISDSRKDEIKEIYKRITKLSKEWHIEYITLYEFAGFLANQGKRKEGIRVGEELKCLYGLSDDTSTEDKVRLLNLLGELYFECKEYEDSESNYREALKIFKAGKCENTVLRAKTYSDLAKLYWKTNKLDEAEKGLRKNVSSLSELVENEPEIYEPVLAATYNYMGILENRRNRLDAAIDFHYKAIEIRERLARKCSSYNYQPVIDLTASYSNLGFVYKKRGEYRKAEEFYKRSIEIRSRNRKRNPSAYGPPLAVVYTNYATLLNVIGKNKEAQEICEKAYRIRYALVQEDPAYKVNLAYTLHEYGIILTAAGEHMYPKAEKYFEEAIAIREKLVGEDAKAYDLELAETKCCYGKLLAKMGDFPLDETYYRKADKYMKSACETCVEYSKTSKGYDFDKISEIYQDYAHLLDECLEKYSEAELYYTKAIEGWRDLTKRCRQVFEPKLKKAEEDLIRLQKKKDEMF